MIDFSFCNRYEKFFIVIRRTWIAKDQREVETKDLVRHITNLLILSIWTKIQIHENNCLEPFLKIVTSWS